MIQLQKLTLRRGGRVLIQDLDILIPERAHVGITGANGCGKSTLLAALREELDADSGRIAIPLGTRIASVAQETPATQAACLAYALEGDAELCSLQRELAAAVAADDAQQIADITARLEAIDAFTAESRAARILHGLGFAQESLATPVRNFSGGWRMRLNLAQALMCRSDLLLLDEPTNHLDLDAIIWLEDWLKSYRGTILLVSHDRDFLDAVTDHILHFEQLRGCLYTGNYSRFEVLRAQALARQQSLHERQQREIAHVRSFISRFRAKASKARQAQSRVKALERMELIAPAHVDNPFSFRFAPPPGLPSPLLRLEQAQLGYGAVPILESVSLTVAPGDRVALLGPNGAGKSTLVKTLAGDIPVLNGERIAAAQVSIGYFAQHQLDQLQLQDSPLKHLRDLDGRAEEQVLRDFLGGFGFPGDMATTTVQHFSGGEKARLVLALLTYQKPNLLLLDEPTNHLDLDMRQALTMALQDFAGGMILVSHDRHLLRCLADELWLVADGKAQPFEGDLDEYARWLLNKCAPAGKSNDTPPANSRESRSVQRRLEAEKRQRLQPLRRRVGELESRIDTLTRRRSEVQEQLSSPALYGDGAGSRLTPLLLEQAQLDKEMAEAETAWLLASEELDAAQQDS
jgi:ATP-binding cassette subfamily F protein 3